MYAGGPTSAGIWYGDIFGSVPFANFFFFQAEDGIRDDLVTGVQTCALPISRGSFGRSLRQAWISRSAPALFPRVCSTRARAQRARQSAGSAATKRRRMAAEFSGSMRIKIGRASCRERV